VPLAAGARARHLTSDHDDARQGQGTWIAKLAQCAARKATQTSAMTDATWIMKRNIQK
jgi:hypothetical protein